MRAVEVRPVFPVVGAVGASGGSVENDIKVVRAALAGYSTIIALETTG